MNNLLHCAWSTGYKETYIKETIHEKYLGLQIDNHINQKNHIDQVLHNLSGASYTLRSVFHIRNINTLTSVYFAYLTLWWSIEYLFGVIHQTVECYLLYKTKFSYFFYFCVHTVHFYWLIFIICTNKSTHTHTHIVWNYITNAPVPLHHLQGAYILCFLKL